MAANYNIYFEITQKVATVQQNGQNLFLVPRHLLKVLKSSNNSEITKFLSHAQLILHCFIVLFDDPGKYKVRRT